MKKKLLIALSAITFCTYAQTVFYNEGFEGAHGWTLNVATGVQGADPNFFTVSDNEGGVAPTGCSVASNGNKTLHITSVFNPSGGASYDAGGLCGLLFCPQTSTRSESPTINCSGRSGITLSFDFIGNGDGLNDNASLYYFDGTSWNILAASLKSPICGGGQGQWTHFSVSLPASANNNPNVKIGFQWVNNDDGVGTDPSFAVNDVKLSVTSALVATLGSTNNVSCFSGSDGSASVSVSGGQAPYTYDWTPGNPSGDGSASVTGLTVGNYTCTIQDNLSASTNVTVTIVSPSALVGIHNATPILCNGDTSTVTIIASGGTAPYTGIGTFTLTAGNYIFFPTDANGCVDTVTFNLTEPFAISSTQSFTVCAGQTISVGENTYSTSGTYTDVLSAANGCDSTVTTQLTVNTPIDVSTTLTAETIQANANSVGYQWIDCNNGNSAIGGETNQSFTATVNGSYAVIITENACSDTSNCVTVASVGLVTSSHSISDKVFPNPTKGNFVIEVQEDANMKITNALGELVKTAELKKGTNTIHMTHENNGMYFIILQGNDRQQIIKLIKQD